MTLARSASEGRRVAVLALRAIAPAITDSL
jgi:hypothetical protein